MAARAKRVEDSVKIVGLADGLKSESASPRELHSRMKRDTPIPGYTSHQVPTQREKVRGGG
eukprot:4535725-Prymnesium_polylepis.1